jgi:hypothetical protein
MGSFRLLKTPAKIQISTYRKKKAAGDFKESKSRERNFVRAHVLEKTLSVRSEMFSGTGKYYVETFFAGHVHIGQVYGDCNCSVHNVEKTKPPRENSQFFEITIATSNPEELRVLIKNI